ncbi:MAG: hypothetical protein RL518_2630 [Pseudomonadota bacterium]
MIRSWLTSPSIPWYQAVLAFRSVGVVLAVVLLNTMEPLGTSSILVSLAGIAGVVVSSRLAQTRLTNLSFFLAFAAAAALLSLGFGVLNYTLSGITPDYFSIARLQLHAQLCLIAVFLTGGATWLFWRARGAITIEAILFAAAAITIFAGHRDYHLDRPKIISSLAWRLGIPHLSMLILVGSAVLAFLLCYLYFASQAVRPRAERATVQASRARRGFVLSTVLVVVLAGIVYLIQTALYQHYNSAMLARVSNGVGMGENLGVSPLTFQSALGSTNQPAGLIRLEGDYSDNPFTPMLYLRESALSQFNGKEMVFAGRAFDTDLPVVSPRSTFTGKEDTELAPRTPLIQSIYTLADHDSAFAVDYPLSIVQLKNPNPTRFKSSYRAYSVAPAFPLSSLSQLEVGDPRWTEEVRSHYLQPHADKRYKELAEEITKGIASPVEKINALTNYLSRTSIYTLTPNHNVSPQDDPVVPFLFGDHRGYCVHFAHAMVYMLRALGIPARIGTGYLTDLSQAKDGHILLRMSDRHAWSEAYIKGTGWVPFDIQPDQVESHADTQVDTKLLEELMGSLEPGEEILPSESTKKEPGMNDPEEIWIPNKAFMIWSVVGVGVFLVLVKATLRHGWRVAPTAASKARWGYISVASLLHDRGVRRAFGETRQQFSLRSPDRVLVPLTNLVNYATYAAHPSLDKGEVVSAIATAHEKLTKVPLWRRTLTALNPSSIAHVLGGGAW